MPEQDDRAHVLAAQRRQAAARAGKLHRDLQQLPESADLNERTVLEHQRDAHHITTNIREAQLRELAAAETARQERAQGIAQQQPATSPEAPPPQVQAPREQAPSSPVQAQQQLEAPGQQQQQDTRQQLDPRPQPQPSVSGETQGLPEKERANRTFGPFEIADSPTHGFDRENLNPNPTTLGPFETVPHGNFPGDWSTKGSQPFHKEVGDVYHGRQVKELHHLVEELSAPEIQTVAVQKFHSDGMSAVPTTVTEQVPVERDFQTSVQLMQATMDRHAKERESWPLFGYNEKLLDREMELEQFDATRDLCRHQAQLDITAEHQARLDTYRTEHLRDQPFLVQQEKLANFGRILNEAAPAEIERRADTLQQTHFPEVYEQGMQLQRQGPNQEISGPTL